MEYLRSDSIVPEGGRRASLKPLDKEEYAWSFVRFLRPELHVAPVRWVNLTAATVDTLPWRSSGGRSGDYLRHYYSTSFRALDGLEDNLELMIMSQMTFKRSCSCLPYLKRSQVSNAIYTSGDYN